MTGVNEKVFKFATELIDKLMHHDFLNGISYRIEGPNTYMEEHYEVNFYRWMSEHKKEFEGTSFCCGATKVAIIDERLGDWILKVGFRRETNKNYVKHETGFDFCEVEAENYVKARAAGLEDYFAQMFLCEEYNGIKFYFQERVKIDEDELDHQASESTGYDSAFDDLDDDDRIYAIFGDTEEIQELIEFLDDEGINDLHSANWGWTKDGNVVALDYSGFVG